MQPRPHITSHQDPIRVTLTPSTLLQESIDDLEVLAELLYSTSEVMLTDLPKRLVERTRRRLLAAQGE